MEPLVQCNNIEILLQHLFTVRAASILVVNSVPFPSEGQGHPGRVWHSAEDALAL